MTSKEALENVVFATPEEYDAIKKDLEVLEILKDWLKQSTTDTSLSKIIIDTEECDGNDYMKIKEWLENANCTK